MHAKLQIEALNKGKGGNHEPRRHAQTAMSHNQYQRAAAPFFYYCFLIFRGARVLGMCFKECNGFKIFNSNCRFYFLFLWYIQVKSAPLPITVQQHSLLNKTKTDRYEFYSNPQIIDNYYAVRSHCRKLAKLGSFFRRDFNSSKWFYSFLRIYLD